MRRTAGGCALRSPAPPTVPAGCAPRHRVGRPHDRVAADTERDVVEEQPFTSAMSEPPPDPGLTNSTGRRGGQRAASHDAPVPARSPGGDEAACRPRIACCTCNSCCLGCPTTRPCLIAMPAERRPARSGTLHRRCPRRCLGRAEGHTTAGRAVPFLRRPGSRGSRQGRAEPASARATFSAVCPVPVPAWGRWPRSARLRWCRQFVRPGAGVDRIKDSQLSLLGRPPGEVQRIEGLLLSGLGLVIC